MNQLLVHADPGARSGFVASWLLNNLHNAGFDVGMTTDTSFLKIHRLEDDAVIKNFSGTKIRIKSTFNLLNLQLLLFLRKNVHTQIPDFTRDEFSLETFSKVYIFAKDCFRDDNELDYSLYDYVITFEDTFNIDKLIDLYQKVNGHYPSEENIKLAIKNNELNQITLDPNHACNISATILETESTMNLLERNRTWSIVDLYKKIPLTELYQAVKAQINPENYQKN